MMIEDFMLAANGCGALCAENRLPLYRVHEKPDAEKLAMFADFLDGIGVNAKGIRHNAAPGDIRAILEKTRSSRNIPSSPRWRCAACRRRVTTSRRWGITAWRWRITATSPRRFAAIPIWWSAVR